MAVLYIANRITDPRRQRAAWLLLKSVSVKPLEIQKTLNIVHEEDHRPPEVRERCLPRGEQHLSEEEVLQNKLKSH